MNLRTFYEKRDLGEAAAAHAAHAIRDAIAARERARIVAATGSSQFEFLEALVAAPAIDWQHVELFHLDEYIGLPMTHRASFCRYLHERLIAKTGITRHHLMNGEEDPEKVIRNACAAIRSAPIDVAFAGIGENAHLAFNDPPADFETHEPYLIVELDEACRRQQVSEGWFASLDEVPKRAITMSIQQILSAREIISVVPDERKATAVKVAVEGPVTPAVPASILQTHPHATLYLDEHSSSLLAPATLASALVGAPVPADSHAATSHSQGSGG